jgi:hypothetical protein
MISPHFTPLHHTATNRQSDDQEEHKKHAPMAAPVPAPFQPNRAFVLAPQVDLARGPTRSQARVSGI